MTERGAAPRFSRWRLFWELMGALLALRFLCVGSEPAPATPFPGEFSVPALDAFLAEFSRKPKTAGLSVALIKDGQMILTKGYGKASLADNTPVDSETRFAIGSVSKQFVCVAILLLAEDGKLSPTDPVARFYPDLARAGEITLLDLMNHVSGYPDYYPLDFLDRRMRAAIEPDELLRQYAGGRLDFEPGTRWSYSNTGYILLGRVVEKVSGESLGAFLEQRLFRPLGMNATSCELENSSDARLARGYATFALSEPEEVPGEARGWLGGAGGIHSTPADLAKWNLALMEGRVLQPASFEILTRPRVLADGRQVDYGCGLSVRTVGGRVVLSHGGAVSGFNAWSGWVPSLRASIVLMSNLEGGLGDLPERLLALLVKVPQSVPSIAGPTVDETVRRVFADLQKGRIDRRQLGLEFNQFLTDAKLRAAARRLKPFGKPRHVDVLARRERGGMEVSTTLLEFKSGSLEVLMYRKPDGTIEQFFVNEAESQQ